MQKLTMVLAAGVAAVALSAPALTAPALAQQGPKAGVPALFEKADADKDGKVTRSEFAALRDERFAAMDTDKDGAISRDERREARKAWRQARREARRARVMARIDADKDGKITEADFVARAKARFARIDADKDGVVTAAELREARKARGDKRGWKRARFHRGHRFGRGPGMRRMMRRVDANRDGKIDKAEFDHVTGLIFARLDRNGDGAIEATELKRRGGKRE